METAQVAQQINISGKKQYCGASNSVSHFEINARKLFKVISSLKLALLVNAVHEPEDQPPEVMNNLITQLTTHESVNPHYSLSGWLEGE